MDALDEVPAETATVPLLEAAEESEAIQTKKCLSCAEYEGAKEAQGYAILGWGRGPVVMSNLFLSISLIYLGSKEAGCVTDDGIIDDNCHNKVYGFQASSLISNIVIISGVLSAVFMPVVGAILDHTSHRRKLGIIASMVLIAIQTVQIGTTQATWFPMLVLQGVAGFFYQVVVLCTYAYLPDLARSVGEDTMTRFASRFYMQQFGAQVCFGLFIAAISTVLVLDSVQQGQLSQALDVLFSGSVFFLGWKILPDAPPAHDLAPGQSLVSAGFAQAWQTFKAINSNYKNSLRWFLLAVVMGEAGTNVFTTLSVVYLQEVLAMSGTETSVVILFTLMSSLPGTLLGAKFTARTDPNTSLKTALVSFSIVTIIAGFILQGPSQAPYAFIFAFLWGNLLGWYYATENLFFSLCLPKGQEAELTGFFTYCTQIMVWFPPLVFTIMNERHIALKWCLMTTSVYLLLAAGTLCMVLPWEQALEEATRSAADCLENRRQEDVENSS